MDFIAERESATAKQIAGISLELIAKKDYDRKTKKLLKLGYSQTSKKFKFNKEGALIKILEIDKRKYTELGVIYKLEGFTIPTPKTYNKPKLTNSFKSGKEL